MTMRMKKLSTTEEMNLLSAKETVKSIITVFES